MKNLIVVFFLFFSFQVAAQAPATLSYQGILMQNDGVTPLTDGAHTIVFSFYTEATDGTALFSRTVPVTTVKGLFTCIIGDGSTDNEALPSSVGEQELYIGLSVDGGSELLPRTRLTSTPYSFSVAENDSGPGPVPVGGIIMWSGAVNEIPKGYVLCDGSNGTPDLRGRFIVGYHSGDGDYNALAKTGGAKTVTLTVAQMPVHNHGGSTGNRSLRTGHWQEWVASDNVVGSEDKDVLGWNSDPADHNHSIPNDGGGQAHENRPPYYVLAFIMKK